MLRVEVGAVADERAGVPALRARRRLDLDDVGAGVGQELAGDLAQVADLEDAQAGEGAHQTAASAIRSADLGLAVAEDAREHVA